MTAAVDLLRVGDLVLWRGAWGSQPARPATVLGIEYTGNPDPNATAPCYRHGAEVQSAPWAGVVVGRTYVLTLSNGHWCYGNQIERADRPRGWLSVLS